MQISNEVLFINNRVILLNLGKEINIMDKEKFINNFKTSVLTHMEQEVLDELNIPYSKWQSMKKAYAQVRSQIGVENDAYYEALENLYTAHKALDSMQF